MIAVPWSGREANTSHYIFFLIFLSPYVNSVGTRPGVVVGALFLLFFVCLACRHMHALQNGNASAMRRRPCKYKTPMTPFLSVRHAGAPSTLAPPREGRRRGPYPPSLTGGNTSAALLAKVRARRRSSSRSEAAEFFALVSISGNSVLGCSFVLVSISGRGRRFRFLLDCSREY